MLSTLQKEQKELKTFLVEQKTNAGNSVKERGAGSGTADSLPVYLHQLRCFTKHVGIAVDLDESPNFDNPIRPKMTEWIWNLLWVKMELIS